MSTKRPAWKIGLICLALISLACQAGSGDPSPMEGKAAPNIILPATDGRTFNLADQRGKVVVLDFWASWCGPCQRGLPHTQELSANPGLAAKGLVVWGIDSTESADTVQNFLAVNRYTFPALIDTKQDVARAYNVQAIPQIIIIGRDGVVKKAFVGYSDDLAANVNKALDAALGENVK